MSGTAGGSGLIATRAHRLVDDAPSHGCTSGPAELGSAQDPPPPEAGGQVLVAEHLLQSLAPRVGVAGGHHQAGIADHPWEAPPVRYHHWRAATHLFGRRQPEAFV